VQGDFRFEFPLRGMSYSGLQPRKAANGSADQASVQELQQRLKEALDFKPVTQRQPGFSVLYSEQ
jgi:hypothetical protein